MGILKTTCSNCGKEVGLNRYKILDGWLCPQCLKMCSLNIKNHLMKCTLDDIKKDIADNEKLPVHQFNTAKKIGAYICFDSEKKQWLVPDGFFGGVKNPRIYNYEDIVDCELLEDGESLTKGGIGSAIVGGVLLGGVGAIVGGLAGTKKGKSITNSMRVKITVKDFNNPNVYIDLVTAKTKTDSMTYRAAAHFAQEIISSVALIIQENNENFKKNEAPAPLTSSSLADELMKLKELVELGVLSQEEFETAKARVLAQ